MKPELKLVDQADDRRELMVLSAMAITALELIIEHFESHPANDRDRAMITDMVGHLGANVRNMIKVTDPAKHEALCRAVSDDLQK